MGRAIGPAEDIEKILALRDELNAADEARDLETYLSLCTDDVVAMPPGRDPVLGIDDLRTFLTETHARGEDGARSFEYETESLVVRDDRGFDRGTLETRSQPSGTDDVRVGRYNYLDLYRRRRDGGWKYDGGAWFPAE